MLIYLAQPIDQADERSKRMAELASATLVEAGATVFRPALAFDSGGDPAGIGQAINRLALREADGVMAVLKHGVPSIGVPIEIQWAVDNGKPVALATDLEVSMLIDNWKMNDNFREVPLDGPGVRSGAQWLRDTVRELAEPAPRRGSTAADRGTAFARALKEAVEPARGGAIVFEKKAENARLPERAYETDAGFDLFTSKDTWLPPGKTTYVNCGVAVDIPDGYWGLVTGRSSTKFKLGLDVTPGVIDEGYSGELFASVHNPTKTGVMVKEGDRLVQLVLLPAVGAGKAAWGRVRPKPRGSNGFGSSGRN